MSSPGTPWTPGPPDQPIPPPGEPVPRAAPAVGDAAGPAGRVRRRRLLFGGATGVAAVVAGAAGRTRYRRRHVVVPLLSETVAFAGPAGSGARQLVLPRDPGAVVPGTRVLRTARGVDRLVAAERTWLADGVSWTRGAGPARDALLDLRVLIGPAGAAVSGWSPGWRYVWPRDAAHVVAALAATGHTADALPILRFLQRAQRPDGGFEARYHPDGSVPADGRPPELDGTGWVLWAATQLAGALALPDAVAALGSVRPLLVRATRHALDAIDTPDGLPAPSPDYWVRATTALTLGTVAPLLAGLSSGAGLLALIGETELARQATAGGQQLATAVQGSFGPLGYPRDLHGSGRDAAVAFLLPPYASVSTPALVTALAESAASMGRPGGGLAPGSSWRDDGISWTAETALFALASAGSGDPATARRRLAWLAAHRTAAGSLPEQVRYDGAPASAAPVAWTAALVLLALNELVTAAGTGPTDLH